MSENTYFDIMGKLGDVTLHPGGLISTLTLVDNFPKKENISILDLGCGTGHSINTIFSLINCKIIGIEINSNMIFSARKNISDKNDFGLIQSTSINLPIKNNYFDVVFSEGALPFMKEKSKIIQEIYRITKPNAIIAHTDFYYVDKPPKKLMDDLQIATNMRIEPYTKKNWIDLFEKNNLKLLKIIDIPIVKRKKTSKSQLLLKLRQVFPSLKNNTSKLSLIANQVLNSQKIFDENSNFLQSSIFFHEKLS